jgi:hypothetical protein
MPTDDNVTERHPLPWSLDDESAIHDKNDDYVQFDHAIRAFIVSAVNATQRPPSPGREYWRFTQDKNNYLDGKHRSAASQSPAPLLPSPERVAEEAVRIHERGGKYMYRFSVYLRNFSVDEFSTPERAAEFAHALKSELAALLRARDAEHGATPQVGTDERWTPAATPPTGTGCKDCQLPYSHFGMDTHLPRSQWMEICPDDADLLCANCILNRIRNRIRGATVVHMIVEVATPLPELPAMEEGR